MVRVRPMFEEHRYAGRDSTAGGKEDGNKRCRGFFSRTYVVKVDRLCKGSSSGSDQESFFQDLFFLPTRFSSESGTSDVNFHNGSHRRRQSGGQSDKRCNIFVPESLFTIGRVLDRQAVHRIGFFAPIFGNGRLPVENDINGLGRCGQVFDICNVYGYVYRAPE